jgi:hypothetical protein
VYFQVPAFQLKHATFFNPNKVMAGSFSERSGLQMVLIFFATAF